MKLIRYGAKGSEPPAVLDDSEKLLDLTGVIPDVAGAALLPESIARLRTLNLAIFQEVADLVSYLSRFMSLQPGDIISTGTPPGVGLGQKPPVYLRTGKIIRLGINGLGEQQRSWCHLLFEGR